MSPDSKETESGRHLCTSQSAGINNVIALVSCRPWKYVPQAISGGMNFIKVDEFSEKVTKVTFTVIVLNTHNLSLLFISLIYLRKLDM